MAEPLVLYSATTLLAFSIAQTYYREVHYAWCAPRFDGSERSDLEPGVPPTSSPYEIYQGLQREVARRDLHSARIRENRAGILRGSDLERDAGVISPLQHTEIAEIVEAAETAYFRPLILVIPFAAVRKLIEAAPVRNRASPLSREIVMPQLPRRLFDVIRP